MPGTRLSHGVTVTLVESLRRAAAAADSAVPAALATALAKDAPVVPINEIEKVVDGMRRGNLKTLFSSDAELRAWYDLMSQRLLARYMTLTERALCIVGEKLEKTPIERLTPIQLVAMLDALGRGSSMLTAQRKELLAAPADPAPQLEELSDDEIERQLAEREANLATARAALPAAIVVSSTPA